MPIVTPPEPEFWQGDIFSDIPWCVIKDHSFVQYDGTRERYISIPREQVTRKGRLVTNGGLDLGMLLSHECIVDKRGSAPLAFARILPITTQNRQDGQDAIRNGDNYQTFYLPATEGLIPECYVDFRLVTAIDSAFLDQLTRIASLNEEGRNSLRLQLILYWTRMEPRQMTLEDRQS